MNVKTNKIKGSKIEIEVEFSIEEMESYLKKGATELSKNVKIDGFRSGHIDYKTLKAKVGEMAIYEEAARIAVSKTCYDVVNEQKLKTIGQPEVEVQKLAPGNSFVYKIIVAVLPDVKLVDYKSHKIKKNKAIISEKEVEKVINGLRKMRATEKIEDRAVKDGDKIEVDFEIYLDKVLVENGFQKKYPFVLGEGAMLLDFEKEVVGMKAGEEKEFKLTFPKDYYEKSLNGRTCDFKVKVNAVYSLTLPELNEKFAKDLGGGISTIEELKEKVKANLQEEADKKEEIRAENEMFDYLIDKSEFGDVPDVLISAEIQKMINELKESITAQGMKYDDYLMHMKKKEADFALDFSPKALRRVKAGLVIHQASDAEKVEVSDKEVDEEIEKIIRKANKDAGFEKYIKSSEYKAYLKNQLMSQKIVDILKEAMIN